MTAMTTDDDKPAAAPTEVERCDPKLLEILVCPFTKTRLVYDAAKCELVSRAAGLAFPIRNGVPLMTAEAARTLDADEGKKR
jgi:uncharacterized protein YbaR (Trm112 family)